MVQHTRDPIKTTTVCVDTHVRDYINEEADRLGLSQRQMAIRLIEAYEHYKEAEDEEPDDVKLKNIYDCLDKVLKRDDRVVAFIKEQEKVLLNPILKSVQSTDAQLNQLIEILSNLE